ncbi:glycoside hydrolase family 32 protein [Bacillus pinisoli]|uniref:glycoside hydrolase family 32 protein n=1 Tax=Bacillus pinisoli TaxID=2901866 RepID=UPI00300DE14A
MKHQEVLKQAQDKIDELKETVSNSHWYPKYHIAPQVGWMNDPNGFSYFAGEYHVFFQHHPFSPHWGPMYWGHAKSKNLATWEHLPIALAPSEEYDKDGCFSGSAVEIDNKLYLFYTGNVWTGEDRDHDLKQVQCVAISEDGVHFEKDEKNPVITSAPEGDIHPFHFRDPKVWKKDETYYMVLGSKTKENRGQILLYRSKDLYEWEFMNIAATGEGNFGFMWECPDIFHLDGHDILLMSPQGMKPEEHKYHNLHQSGYCIGHFDYETGIYQHGPFEMLDYGFDVYAPQSTIDDQGRRIVIAWMNMWESDMPEQQHEWAGSLTLPRIVTMENGELRSRPVPELELLREEEIKYENIKVAGQKELDGIKGSCIELKLSIDMMDSSMFSIKLRTNPESGEETVLSYDSSTNLFTFNRDKSGAGPRGVRHVPISLNNNKLHLQIFLDQSSVEVFINDGEKVMTGRIYPDEKSTGVQFISEGDVTLDMVEKWNISKSIR